MHIRSNSPATTECPQERKIKAFPGKTVVDTSFKFGSTLSDKCFIIFIDYLLSFRSYTIFFIIYMMVFDFNSTDYWIGTGSCVAEWFCQCTVFRSILPQSIVFVRVNDISVLSQEESGILVKLYSFAKIHDLVAVAEDIQVSWPREFIQTVTCNIDCSYIEFQATISGSTTIGKIGLGITRSRRQVHT